jgi:hypothetical protein
MIDNIENFENWVETAQLEDILEMGENLLNILNCQILGLNLLEN